MLLAPNSGGDLFALKCVSISGWQARLGAPNETELTFSISQMWIGENVECGVVGMFPTILCLTNKFPVR